jgi:hypothetical protein
VSHGDAHGGGSAWSGTAPGGGGEDAAEWASRMAEQLPTADVNELARAAAQGPAAVRRLRAQTTAPVLRDACEQLLTRFVDDTPGYLSGLLSGLREPSSEPGSCSPWPSSGPAPSPASRPAG